MPSSHNLATTLHYACLQPPESKMVYVRILAFVLGLMAIALGLLWVGQGTGVVMWPEESFMLADRSWAVRGAILAMVGGIVVWLARRGNGRA